MGDPNGMKGSVKVGLPKGQESTQTRIIRGDVELLPYERLKKTRVIRHAICDLGGCQTVASHDARLQR